MFIFPFWYINNESLIVLKNNYKLYIGYGETKVNKLTDDCTVILFNDNNICTNISG